MPAPRNILIVDRAAPSLSRDLEAHGFVCETRRDITYDEFLHLPDTLCGLVIRSRFQVDKPLIDSKPHLRFIARLGSGVENIDTAYAESRGIACISTPEGNANAVAEHAFGLLLSALRNIPKSDREVRGGEWLREANKGTELASQTIGIIGYGHTGPAFARILRSFGTKVYVYDKFRTDIADDFVTVTDLPTILRECNVISLHVNYLPENYHLVNDAFLDAARDGIILINTCRGLVVDTAALVSHLRDGKVRYACLDVLEYESVRLKIPPKNEWESALLQLSEMENVILTPHIAGQTLEAEQRHADIAVQKILNLSE
jgi:D-3-phosphoglycerate dehydrogenase